ncbi:MAG: type II toxin-antitoxin system RelE/ParE family toxin [Candidatus Lokiarchaeota archaeon]|nr:type II toxin-antitoxin system RelE/ParE family toxin [Candidatus Lokiarchaeota archaeon]
MVTLIWTAPALQKLEEILEYYELQKSDYCYILKERIDEKIELLKNFPQIGRIVPEDKSKQLREIFVDSYQIIYLFSENSIKIVSVLHFKQNFKIK